MLDGVTVIYSNSPDEITQQKRNIKTEQEDFGESVFEGYDKSTIESETVKLGKIDSRVIDLISEVAERDNKDERKENLKNILEGENRGRVYCSAP